MGYTKDLWTKPVKGLDGKPVLLPSGKAKRVPNARHGKGKRWLACWLDPEGTERTKAYANKVPADKYWAKMETDRDRGEYYDPKAGLAIFDAIARRWLSSRNVDPSTAIRYESLYRLHVEPEFGKRAVKAIKPSDVQKWQTALSRQHGSSTVAGARLVLLGVLDLAVADDLIKANPVRSDVVQGVDFGEPAKIIAWSDDRVFGIIDAHPEEQRLLPTIGAACGHREGEAFAVALEDIDFENEVIHVRRQIKKLGPNYVFALPKSDRVRETPMAPGLAQTIKSHVAVHPPQPLTLPWERPDGKLVTAHVLIRWIDGRHLTPRAYSETMWKPALVKAKVIPAPEKDARGRCKYATTRKEGFHQLRHYCASVMLADGVDIVEVAAYFGHRDPSFTQKVYGHMLPDSHGRAQQAINARLFRPRAVSYGT